MTDAVFNRWALSADLPAKALKGAATYWFGAAALGHWIFVAYLLGHYVPLIFDSGVAGLERSTIGGEGFDPADAAGNWTALVHVALAVIVIGGGPLQLIPQLRARLPRFHRVLGRTYVVAAVASALAGLYMIWTRGTVGGLVNAIAISGDAVLILVCAGFAARYAIGRDIARHRRWAMRLFLVSSAVWFYRVSLMGWAMLTGGAGIDWETFSGPFISFLGFAQYLVPLAMLECYFRAKASSDPLVNTAVAVTLAGLTSFMVVGIFAATMGLWLPRI